MRCHREGSTSRRRSVATLLLAQLLILASVVQLPAPAHGHHWNESRGHATKRPYGSLPAWLGAPHGGGARGLAATGHEHQGTQQASEQLWAWAPASRHPEHGDHTGGTRSLQWTAMQVPSLRGSKGAKVAAFFRRGGGTGSKGRSSRAGGSGVPFTQGGVGGSGGTGGTSGSLKGADQQDSNSSWIDALALAGSGAGTAAAAAPLVADGKAAEAAAAAAAPLTATGPDTTQHAAGAAPAAAAAAALLAATASTGPGATPDPSRSGTFAGVGSAAAEGGALGSTSKATAAATRVPPAAATQVTRAAVGVTAVSSVEGPAAGTPAPRPSAVVTVTGSPAAATVATLATGTAPALPAAAELTRASTAPGSGMATVATAAGVAAAGAVRLQLPNPSAAPREGLVARGVSLGPVGPWAAAGVQAQAPAAAHLGRPGIAAGGPAVRGLGTGGSGGAAAGGALAAAAAAVAAARVAAPLTAAAGAAAGNGVGAGSTLGPSRSPGSAAASLSPPRRTYLPPGWLPPRQQFLYPLMPYGPNNQMVSLKEVLALGKLINRTVIVPDIRTHYLEANGSIPKTLPFADVFDLDHLARHYSVVTLAQTRQAGWSSKVGAMVTFKKKDYREMKRVMKNMGIGYAEAKKYDVGRYGSCGSKLSKIKSKTRGNRVTLVVAYQTIVANAGHGLDLAITGNMCHDEYLKVCQHVVKSAKIVRLAADFIARRLNGTKYVAVQIRPYPDDCVDEMLKPGFSIKKAGKLCKNGGILTVFVNQTKAALAAAGTHTLVLFAPPSIRHKLATMYEAAGVRPVMYDARDLRREFNHVSNTLLGFVEEEIGLRAEVFVGTHDSSITGMIIQERYAHGRPKASSYTWRY